MENNQDLDVIFVVHLLLKYPIQLLIVLLKTDSFELGGRDLPFEIFVRERLGECDKLIHSVLLSI